MKGPPLGIIREEVRRLRAYGVEEPEGQVKLDANENPHAPPEKVRRELAVLAGETQLNRYPDPSVGSLRDLLAQRHDWPREGIVVGNGSDELIAILVTACGGDDATLLCPVPTFVMYRHIGLVNGWRVEEVPLDSSFDLDEEGLMEALQQSAPGIVFLAYPNNPTGNCFRRETVERVVRISKGLVVVDEAYGDFSGKTFLPLMRECPNLIVMRSLSKVGLAALRLGYLLAAPELAQEFDKVRLPYNVSTFSQEAALSVLRNPGRLEQEVAALVREREIMAAELADCAGLESFRSDANFILFRTQSPADEVYRGLCEAGILVRNLSSPGPLKNCLRVTVGLPEENRLFLEALRKVLG